jgi:DNA-directed RNA polymerase specialized sigma24 family protein
MPAEEDQIVARHAENTGGEHGSRLMAQVEGLVLRVRKRMGTTHTSIIDGVRLRCSEAQARFYQQYWGPIRSYFAAPGKKGWNLGDDVAEELAEEVIVNLCYPKDSSGPIKLDTYARRPVQRSFRRWLFPVLDRRAIDYLRARRRSREVLVHEDSDGCVHVPEDDTCPDTPMTDSEAEFIRSRRLIIIRQALRDARAVEKKGNRKKGTVVDDVLVPFDVDIVVRHKAQGESYKDIAKAAKLTEDAVRARARVGRQRLATAIRAILKAENPDWSEERLDDEIVVLEDPLGNRDALEDTEAVDQP